MKRTNRAEKAKVLLVISTLRIRGAEKVILEHAATINKKMFSVFVLARDTSEKYVDEIEQAKEHGVEITLKCMRSPLSNILFTIPIFGKIITRSWMLIMLVKETYHEFRLYKAIKPDIIHFFNSGGFNYFIKKIIAKFAGIPVILTTYHTFPIRTREDYVITYGRFYVFISNYFTVLGLRYFDKVLVALTKAEKVAHIKTGIPIKKIEVISNGINIGRFLAISDTKAPTSCKNKEIVNILYDKQKLIIGSIGGLRPVKGYIYIILPAKYIVNIFSNVYFIIWGEGSERTKLEQNIEAASLMERFFLPGLIKHCELPSILPLIDVYVLPSLSEAQPLSMMEAMLAGLPIIASNIHGIPDTLGKNGEAGILTKPKDSNSLLNAILRLIYNKEERELMGKVGRKRVQKLFNIKDMSLNYEKLYSKLLNNYFYARQSGG